MTNLETLLSKLTEAREKATPNKWNACTAAISGQGIESYGWRAVGPLCAMKDFDKFLETSARANADAEFIVAAVNALPALLEIIKSQAETLKEYGNCMHFSFDGCDNKDEDYEPENPSGEPGNIFCGKGLFTYEDGWSARAELGKSEALALEALTTIGE